jgi:hypothetical protein
MTTRILIDNVGEFHIPHEKINDVLNYLNNISATKGQSHTEALKQEISIKYKGQELLND